MFYCCPAAQETGQPLITSTTSIAMRENSSRASRRF